MSEPFVHPSAAVEEGASLGIGTKIWHFTHVMGGAVVGRDCTLGQNVFVADGVSIGDRVKIQNNVSIYSGVTLEDDVFCGPSMVFTNVRNPRAAFPIPRASYEPTLVRRGVTIGANATIVCGIMLGEHVLVAAGAVVIRDAPAYALVAGVPAQRIGWTCECGEILRLKDSLGVCATCGRQYREVDGVLEPLRGVRSA